MLTKGLPRLPGNKIIGRQRELDIVLSTVRERSTQLLTILGSGGVGKTRLLLTAAWELAPLFSDGVVFLSFAAPDPDHVWHMIMTRLNIPNASEHSNFDILRSKSILIVIDNCETITSELWLLPDLLDACPGLIVIATSQEAINIRGETELWLQPLDLPADMPDITPEAARIASAVELFVQRTHRRNAEFELNAGNAADISAIVRMLDGLPLAIELAASQMRHLSPVALRQRLETALPSLSGGPQHLPERQRSLINLMEWSLSLLEEVDRERFLRLAVFTGDFTPETASSIMGVSSVDGWALLMSFADKSLIKRVVKSEEASTRFFMLHTVHSVALYMLQQRTDQYEAASILHAQACLSVAREAASHWHSGDPIPWFTRMEEEHPNIEVAMERALDQPRLVPIALELTYPMFWFWYARRFHLWALQMIDQLLHTNIEDLSPNIVGSAHVTVGWLAFKQTQVDRAAHHFREGIRLIENDTSPAALLGAIGSAYVLFSDGENAEEALEQLQGVISRAKTNRDAWHELLAGHFGVGLTAYFEGDIKTAQAAFETSLRLARARDNRHGISINLLYLAHVDRIEERTRAAINKLQEAIPTLLDLEEEVHVLLALEIVISLLADVGEYGMARRIVAFSEHMRHILRIPRSVMDQTDFDDALEKIGIESHSAGLHVSNESPEIADVRQVVAEFLDYCPPASSHHDTESPVAAILSPRELEILRMVSTGKKASEIAETLYVSRHTVKRHMANIRDKLGVRTQAAAVAALQRKR